MPSEKTTPDVHVGNAQEPVLTVGEEGGPRAPAPPAAGEVRSRAPLTEEERAWEEVRRQPAHEHRPPPLPFRVPRPNTASGSGGESTATEGEWRSPELLEAQAAMEETSAVRPITDAAEALAFQRREDDDVWRAVEVVERMARFLANPKDEDRAVVRHACDVIRGGRPGQANGPLWRARASPWMRHPSRCRRTLLCRPRSITRQSGAHGQRCLQRQSRRTYTRPGPTMLDGSTLGRPQSAPRSRRS